MKNTLKKVLALALVACTLLGLIVPIALADGETVIYEFYQTKYAGKALSTNHSAIAERYELSKEHADYINWKYESSSYTLSNTDMFRSQETSLRLGTKAGGWVALRIKSPGPGVYNITLKSGGGYHGAAEGYMYILENTSDIAGATATATPVIDNINWCASESKTDYSSKTVQHTFGNAEEYIVVFYAKTKSSNSNYAYMYPSALTMTKVEPEAKIGDASYATLQDAIDAAKPDDEIILQTAAEADEVIVPVGVTLNLNGKTLTAVSVNAAAPGATVIDRADGVGLLKTALTADGNNGGYLPLTDSKADGYRFFQTAVTTVDAASAGENGAKLRFKVAFTGVNKANAYKLVKSGNSGMTIAGTFEWTTANDEPGSKSGNFEYADPNKNFAADWAEQASGNDKIAIRVTMTDLDAVKTLTLTPAVSCAGVTIASGTALEAK